MTLSRLGWLWSIGRGSSTAWLRSTERSAATHLDGDPGEVGVDHDGPVVGHCLEEVQGLPSIGPA